MRSYRKHFDSARYALKHLKKVRPVFQAWKDNTQQTCNAITMRAEYPWTPQLPKGVKFMGLSVIEARIGKGFFTKPVARQLNALKAVAKVAEQAGILFFCSPRTGERRDIFFGYRRKETGLAIDFSPGLSTQNVCQMRAAYEEFFQAIGREVRFVERDEGFELKPRDAMRIEILGSDFDNSPSRIAAEISERYPGEGLEALIRLIAKNSWKIRSNELFASFASPLQSPGAKSQSVLNTLNRAGLPIAKWKIEIWVTTESWERLDALVALAKMDVEKTGIDLEIVRIKLSSGRVGYVVVQPRKVGFDVGIVGAPDEDEDEFQKELGSLLNKGTAHP
jgi:hypothetical protein